MEIIKKTTEEITKHALAVIDKIEERQVSKMIETIITSVIGITANLESTLSKLLDVVINIDSKTKEPWKHYTSNVLKGNYDDLTPMGTLFEDSTHLFLDGLIAEFMSLLGKKEQDLKKRHAIIE